ncbi:MAG: DEAD/DEAH box helicase [Nitrososphaerales archaeon]
MKIKELPIPEKLIGLIESLGYSDLYPPQEEAVKAGVLEGQNLILTTPTASGKTLVAMLAAGKTVLEGLGKVVYLTPLRALANEKYNDFKAFERLTKIDGKNVKVLISTGDYDSSGESLGAGDILILTNEKFDSVLRHGVSWIDSVKLFVTDEIHVVGDDDRGPTLEMTVTKILSYAHKAQILALSATVKNSKELANWLRAKLIDTRWRPIKLVEGIYQQGEIRFSDGSIRKIKPTNRGPAIDVAIDTVAEGGQSLIFTETRRMAVSLALKASEVTQHYLKDEAKEAKEISKDIISAGEETELSRTLSKVVEKGAAFHHAGLAERHRSIVEDSFKKGLIKILTATPTLCLVPGTKLIRAGNHMLKRIEELSCGDNVLTHTGQFKEVMKPLERWYDGEILTIYPYHQLPMGMTPEHMVLISRRRRRCIHRYKRGGDYRYNRHTVHWYEHELPKWIEAKHVKKGDLLLFPRIKETRDVEFINLLEYGIDNADGAFRGCNQYATYRTKHGLRHTIPALLPLNEDLLWLIGCYIAEGSVSKGFVAFNIGPHEDRLKEEIVRRVKRAFGIEPSVKDSGTKRKVIVCSRILARLFPTLCGKHAKAKHIPFNFLFLPRQKLVSLLKGVWVRDGTYGEYDRDHCARYSTSSEDLAHQLYIILVRLGYIPSIRVQRRKMHGRSASVSYVLSISGRQLSEFCQEVLEKERKRQGKKTYNVGHIDDEYLYLPVRKVERWSYSGPVYNLEVVDDSSYVGSFIVHNSAGVNLPARRVVISSLMRYDSDYGGRAPISVLEYKQMCLPYWKKVLMSDGRTIPIGEIVEKRLDDRVITFDQRKGKFVYGRIIDWFSREADHLLEIETSGGLKIQLTPEHPILTKERGWVPAKDVRIGERVGYLTLSTTEVGRFSVLLPEASSYRVLGCVKTRAMLHQPLHTAYSRMPVLWNPSPFLGSEPYSSFWTSKPHVSNSLIREISQEVFKSSDSSPRINSGAFSPGYVRNKMAIELIEWLKIKDVKPINSSIKVYNIAVEGTENYLAENFIVHNCGRAGRPKYDDIGETVIIASYQRDADEILYNYIKGEPEPVRSKLYDERALRTHLLATIASLPGITDADIINLLSKSLLATQYRRATIQSKVNRVMNYLEGEGLIEKRGKRYIASEFGKRVSTLYIDPVTGVIFRRAISFADRNKPHLLGFLHLIVSSPDFAPKFPLRNRDVDEALMLIDQYRDEFLLPIPEQYHEDYLEDFRSLLVLYGWINEWGEDKLLDKLGVEPGDLYRAVENSEWLIHSLFELSKLLGRVDLLPEIEELRQRIEQGIKSELIPLAKLEGVGRVRARSLYNHGFTDLEKLASASVDKIASVPKIGTIIAKSIKKQLSRSREE